MSCKGKSTDSGAGVVDLYKELSKQAKAVSSLIDKELPNLTKLHEPIGELHAKYQQAMDVYQSYMDGKSVYLRATSVVMYSNLLYRRSSEAYVKVG